MRVSPELQSPTRNAYPPNYLGRASAMGALFAFFLVVSGPRAADDNEVKRTWDAAEVAVERSGVRVVGRMDDPRVQAGLTKLRVGRAIPTVIYMHGCDGLRRSTSVSRALVRRGFAVIAPDSFARSGRVAMCGRGGEAKRRMRHEEIRFAARQALTLAWVDPNNLVLFGHSEGGWAVTSYNGDEFKARIASGTACWAGVRGSSPLLSRIIHGAP